jgi:hypothetical protein
MAVGLCSLSLEILLVVCQYLDPPDFVSITHVNKILYQQLRGSQPSTFILEVRPGHQGGYPES